MIHLIKPNNFAYDDFILDEKGFYWCGKAKLIPKIKAKRKSDSHLIIPDISPLLLKFLKQIIKDEFISAEIIMLKTGINIIFADDVDYTMFLFNSNSKYFLEVNFEI